MEHVPHIMQNALLVYKTVTTELKFACSGSRTCTVEQYKLHDNCYLREPRLHTRDLELHTDTSV